MPSKEFFAFAFSFRLGDNQEVMPVAWLSSKWLKVLLGVLGVGCVIAIIIPCPCRSRESARRAACQSNLKQISLAIRQYSEDFDGRLPLTRVGDVPGAGYRPAYGWADAIAPYSFASSDFARVLQCPSEYSHRPDSGATGPVSPSSRYFTDYWFNARLSHLARQRLAEPASILLAGEGNDGRENCTARYALSTLPEAWRTAEDSPALRHMGGANYAFADGHTKWLKPESVLPNKTTGTFLPGAFQTPSR